MKVIKLDAIDSTNKFLKGLLNSQTVGNYTVVTAENQTQGKGQMGSVWSSEIGKNLIMSILIKDFLLDVSALFNLNIVVSLAVIQALDEWNIPKLSIKWPNDIMSDQKKIGGILIENSIKSDGTIISVVGLGLNVNQTNFENLPKASSLAVVCNIYFEKEELLSSIVEKIIKNVQLWDNQADLMWLNYTDMLFKRGIPMPFQDKNEQKFMGIIQGVSPIGRLQILLEDDTVSEFEIKEMEMLY
ncbi:biotin--[acetyl-CoA-carboxylase] ligase [Flavobacterium psychrotolerans]|uniref:Biotin--[acetyl-CoA-carboxylase] ligase n=1 Tax=Flavobacterium psychrotolerans TaxID=2169410 RepID=A0A2U1JLW2_9FLAO|nr:biotin--[acetyl-CoA-carboxylase] ligase [Flavobacterium psychrotolerans]PWA05848.1 biotin--[acetyl-CoA-carboxylase] ligase [Flavobacterium psychrotolerans]